MVVGCANKRPVTFARTGDVDVNTLPDPATLPPPVVSLAEALRGHCRETDVTPNAYRDQAPIQNLRPGRAGRDEIAAKATQ